MIFGCWIYKHLFGNNVTYGKEIKFKFMGIALFNLF